MSVNPLDLHALRISECADSAAELDYRIERLAGTAKLVDCGPLDVADHSNHGPDDRHEDNVAGLELFVALLVSGQQQSVEIDGADQLIAAAKLDFTQAAYFGDTASRAERVGYVRQRADSVGAGLLDFADDEDLDGLELAHRNVNFDAGDLAGVILDEFFGLREIQTRDLQRTNFRDTHTAVAADGEIDVVVDSSPHQHLELVAGADHVIVANRDVGHRSEGRDTRGKQRVAELLQVARARRSRRDRGIESAELRFNRRRWLVQLVRICRHRL